MIRIRSAAADSVSELFSMEAESFSDPWNEAGIRGFLSESHATALLAEWDGVPCAYLFATLLAPEGEILRIATKANYRGRGIAKALLSRFADEAAEKGCHRLFLEVRKTNEAARALYESFGFTPMGERKNYYRNPTEDAVLYQYTTKCEEMQ